MGKVTEVLIPPQRLHVIEVAKAAGAQKHEREQEKVVAGVDKNAGGKGASGQPRPAQHQADAHKQKKWTHGVASLIAVHEGK